MPTLPKNPSSKKTVIPPEKKKNWVALLLPWVFIVGAIGGIVWMVAAAPKQKELVCRNNRNVGLTTFGTCTEE